LTYSVTPLAIYRSVNVPLILSIVGILEPELTEPPFIYQLTIDAYKLLVPKIKVYP